MRLQLAFALIGALSLSLPASAAEAASPATVVSAGAAGSAAPADSYEDLQGYFQLTDGRELRVYSARNKLYAKFSGGSRTEIVPVAAHEFAAPDGSVRIAFADRACTVQVTSTVAR